MRLRPYIDSKDYQYLEMWVNDERTHTLWCANLFQYPLTKENFRSVLEKNATDWTDSAYVATDDDGTVIGFFCYSMNVENSTGFLKFVIVDPQKRGSGYGKEMLELALRYAFDITGAEQVQLNVFAENTTAKRCYEKLGFVERSIAEGAFPYKEEVWGRCNMVVTRSGGK